MKIKIMISLFFLMLTGCSPSSNKIVYCQIGVKNNSAKDILFAEIGSNKTSNHFGLISSDNIHGVPLTDIPSGTAAGCKIEISKNFRAKWEENDIVQEAKIDIMQYETKIGSIKYFTFIYLGNKKWKVIARADTDDSSPIVLPK